MSTPFTMDRSDRLDRLQHFDRLFAADPDPWHYRSRWYEQRKRAMTLAALPSPRYDRACEPGCANGEFTAMLAPRCGRLLASDGSVEAVKRARARLADVENVELAHAVMPEAWPDGRFDLIVLGEFGYYLDDAALDGLLLRCAQSSTPVATWLACHWRHRADDFHRDGDAVHAVIGRAALAAGFERFVHHLEADFVLEVWCRGVPEAST